MTKPVKQSKYICDKKFHTDYAKELIIEDPKKYGIVTIFGEETHIYSYQNNNAKLIHRITISRQKKQNNGGQSQNRIMRLREEQIHSYVKSICENMTKSYIKNDIEMINGLFIAGSGFIKDQVNTSPFLHKKIKNKIVKVYSSDTNNIHDISLIANNYFNDIDQKECENLMKEFLAHIETETNLISYGYDETISKLEYGAVKTLVLLKDKFSEQTINAIKNIALNMNTEVIEIYSNILESYGGIVSFLRYKID